MNSMSDSILRRIRAKRHGWVFTPKDFIDLAPRNTIGIVLYRLVKKGIIRKLDHGIYDFPIKHSKLGTLSATPDAIAKAITARSGDIIQPSGAQLANQLGLDTQVSAKPSYITSGHSTRKKIASYPITLGHSKFLNKAPLTINAIKVLNALQHIGKNNITDDMVRKCKRILSKKDKSQLKKSLNQLPNWMVIVILKIIGTQNERDTSSKPK